MDENPLPILRDGTPLEYRFPLCVSGTLCEFVIPQLIMTMPPSTRVLWMASPGAGQIVLADKLSWDCVSGDTEWFSDMNILMSEKVMETYDIIFTDVGISMDIMRLAAESHTLVITPRPHVFFPGLVGGGCVGTPARYLYRTSQPYAYRFTVGAVLYRNRVSPKALFRPKGRTE